MEARDGTKFVQDHLLLLQVRLAVTRINYLEIFYPERFSARLHESVFGVPE